MRDVEAPVVRVGARVGVGVRLRVRVGVGVRVGVRDASRRRSSCPRRMVGAGVRAWGPGLRA